MVSLCPGWVRTEMGGAEASLNIDQSIDIFENLLSNQFFENNETSKYQGNLIKNNKIVKV